MAILVSHTKIKIKKETIGAKQWKYLYADYLERIYQGTPIGP